MQHDFLFDDPDQERFCTQGEKCTDIDSVMDYYTVSTDTNIDFSCGHRYKFILFVYSNTKQKKLLPTLGTDTAIEAVFS